MVNSNLLKSYIYKRELSVNDMCVLLGISYSSWYRKVRNNDFSTKEVKLIKEKLKINDEDTLKIFLK